MRSKEKLQEIMSEILDTNGEVSESYDALLSLKDKGTITEEEYEFMVKHYDKFLMTWICEPTKAQKKVLDRINKEWSPIVWEYNLKQTDDEINVFQTKIDGVIFSAQSNPEDPDRLYGFNIRNSYSNFEVNIVKDLMKNIVKNAKKAYAIDTLRECLRDDIESETIDVLNDEYSSFKKVDETGEYYMEDIEDRAREDVIDNFLDNNCYPDFFSVVLKDEYNDLVYVGKDNIFVPYEEKEDESEI